MGLERALGYFNVIAGDAVFAIVGASCGTHMVLDESTRSPENAAALGFVLATIAAKNVYDYYRFGKHVEREGWSPGILKESYGWVGKPWAEAHSQEKEYYGAAPGGWGSKTWF
jgi:hypothetical protein